MFYHIVSLDKAWHGIRLLIKVPGFCQHNYPDSWSARFVRRFRPTLNDAGTCQLLLLLAMMIMMLLMMMMQRVLPWRYTLMTSTTIRRTSPSLSTGPPAQLYHIIPSTISLDGHQTCVLPDHHVNSTVSYLPPYLWTTTRHVFYRTTMSTLPCHDFHHISGRPPGIYSTGPPCELYHVIPSTISLDDHPACILPDHHVREPD